MWYRKVSYEIAFSIVVLTEEALRATETGLKLSPNLSPYEDLGSLP